MIDKDGEQYAPTGIMLLPSPSKGTSIGLGFALSSPERACIPKAASDPLLTIDLRSGHRDYRPRIKLAFIVDGEPCAETAMAFYDTGCQPELYVSERMANAIRGDRQQPVAARTEHMEMPKTVVHWRVHGAAEGAAGSEGTTVLQFRPEQNEKTIWLAVDPPGGRNRVPRPKRCTEPSCRHLIMALPTLLLFCVPYLFMPGSACLSARPPSIHNTSTFYCWR